MLWDNTLVKRYACDGMKSMCLGEAGGKKAGDKEANGKCKKTEEMHK